MIHVQDIGIATIAIPLKYDNVGREMTAKKSAKKRAARSKVSFFFQLSNLGVGVRVRVRVRVRVLLL